MVRSGLYSGSGSSGTCSGSGCAARRSARRAFVLGELAGALGALVMVSGAGRVGVGLLLGPGGDPVLGRGDVCCYPGHLATPET